ncbi:MAG TPA: DUF503 domain-containing protein [bacterium]|jgi:uncharacterized protein|nr:DUF503 domain-containing protein [bacterium]HLY22588.1 DUF503 domain-containing protein [bacterium]
MVVGVLHVECGLPGTQSIKDKRRIVKSILDRLHHRFNVAAAEVTYQDSWRRAGLAVACVSTDTRHADSVLARVAREIEHHGELVLLDYSTEMR